MEIAQMDAAAKPPSQLPKPLVLLPGSVNLIIILVLFIIPAPYPNPATSLAIISSTMLFENADNMVPPPNSTSDRRNILRIENLFEINPMTGIIIAAPII
ncbi:hypothetical protein ES703_72952 [subsurface metagenome]